MLPLGDDNSDRIRTPFVNYLLIAINILVFVFLQGMGHDEVFTYAYSTVPAEILTGRDIAETIVIKDLTGDPVSIPLGPTLIPVWGTLITSMFMHGGWAHIGGNMLYLWVFGDNIENRLGHARYLLFYLLTGVIASLAHVFTTSVMGQNPYIPSLGASGAISAIMGAYLLLFPGRRVNVLLLFFIVPVPAIVALGFWILLQVMSSMGTLGEDSVSSGVAYAAHIGGFIAGFVLVKMFAPKIVEQAPAPRRERRGFF